VFKTRSDQLEFIDTGEYTAAEYEGCLAELRRINRFLGDETALENSLLREIQRENLQAFSVLDIGAGSGELLRFIANFAGKRKLNFALCGLELNARSARAILEESKNFSQISAVRANALKIPFADNSFDYAICSLFTHHFSDENIAAILREMSRVARRKIFVIDLHRHPLAYFLYTTAGKLILHNRLIRHDGALSILRSFKPQELEDLARKADLKEFSVKRHFPFRVVLQAKSD
jgi:ubiquinone/menaquinone biosynthesis C-methylase UbiE